MATIKFLCFFTLMCIVVLQANDWIPKKTPQIKTYDVMVNCEMYRVHGETVLKMS